MAFLFRLLAHLPLAVLHNLGAALGWLVWLASPTYRRHLRENIGQAGLGAHRNEAVVAAGQALMELPYVWLRPQDDMLEAIVKVSGWEHVEAAWAANQGILFLTPHLGCFEITAQYYAKRRPITVLFRPPKQAWLRPLIETGRGSRFKLAPADLSGVRSLMRALRNKEAVGMLPDQAPGVGEGIWAPFFGKPAYTMTLAARLSENAIVLLAFAQRLPYGAGFHLIFRPLKQALTGTMEERAVQLNREIEALIRECPGQYLWGYNRYKRPAGAPLPPC